MTDKRFETDAHHWLPSPVVNHPSRGECPNVKLDQRPIAFAKAMTTTIPLISATTTVKNSL